MKKYSFLILFLALLTATLDPYAVSASSQEYVTGNTISEDTTWTLDDSPLTIMEDLTVLPHVTLTVEAGVEVRFASGTDFIILGSIVVSGTSEEPVLFTSAEEVPKPADWDGIRVMDSVMSNTIEWTIVEFSDRGIFSDNSSVTIRNCLIRNNYENGVLSRMGDLRIYDSMIVDNKGSGVYSYGYDPRNKKTIIVNTVIENNKGYGVYVVNGKICQTTITNSTITQNTFSGIYMESDGYGKYLIENNTVINNNIGSITGGSKARRIEGGIAFTVGYGDIYNITNNVISENGAHGVNVYLWYSYASQISITGNHIQGNQGNGILIHSDIGLPDSLTMRDLNVVENHGNGVETIFGTIENSRIYSNMGQQIVNTGTEPLQATNNWWGTTDNEEISETLQESENILYEPFLTEPASGTFFLSETDIEAGDQLYVEGTISPSPIGMKAEITLTGPRSTEIVQTVALDNKGGFSLPFTPDTEGDWLVKCIWIDSLGNEGILGEELTVRVHEKSIPTEPPTPIKDPDTWSSTLTYSVGVLLALVLAGSVYLWSRGFFLS